MDTDDENNDQVEATIFMYVNTWSQHICNKYTGSYQKKLQKSNLYLILILNSYLNPS